MFKLSHVSLNFSEHCNLKCRYCYISHSKFSSERNEKVRSKLKDRSFISDIKKYFGSDIMSLGLWGSEPSLNLDVLADVFNSVLENFPLLNDINFSTNLSADINVNNIVYFLETLRNKYNYKGNIRMQVSIDGPKDIHEYNRGSNFEKLKENILKLHSLKSTYNFGLGVKGTYDQYANNIFLKDIRENEGKNIIDYGNFLKSINNRFYHTIVVPGTYTKEDGIIYSEITNFFRQNDLYYDLLEDYKRTLMQADNLRFDRNIYHKLPHYYGCHAGMSSFGLNLYNDTINYCQHGFSFNKDDKLITDKTYYERSGIKFSPIDKSNFIVDFNTTPNSEYTYYKVGLERSKNFVLKYNLTKSFIIQLAKANLINKRYLEDEKLLSSFTLYQILSRVCLAGNMFSAHVAFMPSEGVIKLYANGAFEKVFDLISINGDKSYFDKNKQSICY